MARDSRHQDNLSEVSAYSDDIPSDAEVEGEPEQNQAPTRRRNDPTEW